MDGHHRIRRASYSDLEMIWGLQHSCYDAELVESRETFECILQQQLSFVVEAQAGYIVGCLLGHKWSDLFNPPELNNFHSEEMREGAWDNRVYYIHDLTLAKDVQGMGLGKCLVETFLDRVNAPIVADESQPIVTLVAVRNSRDFWIKQGFRSVSCCMGILETYKDPSATYMISM